MAVEGGFVGEAWIHVRPYTGDFAPQLQRQIGASVAVAEKDAAAASEATAATRVKASTAAGTAIENVSHKTRRAYADVASAEANLAATTTTYGSKSAQAAVASERLHVAQRKLDTSMVSNETHAARLSGRMSVMGHGIIRSTGGLLLGGLALEEFSRRTAEASVNYEEATAQIQANSGATEQQVRDLGKAFLDQAKSGDTTFTANQSVAAFARVSGQLKLTEGRVLSTADSIKFMTAAQHDAEATGQDLTSVTGALSATMQAFHIPLSQVNAESDKLFNISKSLNVPIQNVSLAVDRLHSRLGVAAPSLGDTGALMVSFGKAGVQGQRGLMAVSSALSTLLSTSRGGTKATHASAMQIAEARIAQQTATDNVIKAEKTYGRQSEQYAIAVERQQIATAKLNTTLAGTPGKTTAAQKTVRELGLHVFDAHGKFVGMESIIRQLAPRLAKMSDAQRSVALQTLFGRQAAQLMGQVIAAGVPGWKSATTAVNAQGTAQAAAAIKAHTLGGETKTLGAQFGALEIEIGDRLVPKLKEGTDWLIHHQGAAEAAAGVIGGILVLSIAHYVGSLIWSTGQTVVNLARSAASWLGFGTAAETAGAEATAGSLAAEEAAARAEASTATMAAGGISNFARLGAAAIGVAAAIGTFKVGSATAHAGAAGAGETSLMGAVAGAAIGLSVGGPFGAAIGGAVGALAGLAIHFHDAAQNADGMSGSVKKLGDNLRTTLQLDKGLPGMATQQALEQWFTEHPETAKQFAKAGIGLKDLTSYLSSGGTQFGPSLSSPLRKALSVGLDASGSAVFPAGTDLIRKYLPQLLKTYGTAAAGAAAVLALENIPASKAAPAAAQQRHDQAHNRNMESYSHTTNALLTRNNQLLGQVVTVLGGNKPAPTQHRFASTEFRPEL